jgi:hypothetical protein
MISKLDSKKLEKITLNCSIITGSPFGEISTKNKVPLFSNKEIYGLEIEHETIQVLSSPTIVSYFFIASH